MRSVLVREGRKRTQWPSSLLMQQQQRVTKFSVRLYHTSMVPSIVIIPPKKKVTKRTNQQKRQEIEKIRAANQLVNENAKKSGFKTDWSIKSAVIVERPQVLVPPYEPWLEKYDEWRKRWDSKILELVPPITILEEDVDVLKQKENEAKAKEKEKQKILATETEEEKKEREEKEEREARMAKLRAAHKKVIEVKVGSRITAADLKNDVRSVYRKLDERLFLIVKKNRSTFSWQFPQGSWLEEETLRDTAERVLKKRCNKSQKLDTYFFANAPVTFCAYPYPTDVQKTLDTYGSKVFFYYSYYLNGEVTLDPTKYTDYAWVTKQELSSYIEGNYLEQLLQVLPDNGLRDLLTREMSNYYFELDRKEKLDKQRAAAALEQNK